MASRWCLWLISLIREDENRFAFQAESPSKTQARHTWEESKNMLESTPLVFTCSVDEQSAHALFSAQTFFYPHHFHVMEKQIEFDVVCQHYSSFLMPCTHRTYQNCQSIQVWNHGFFNVKKTQHIYISPQIHHPFFDWENQSEYFTCKKGAALFII